MASVLLSTSILCNPLECGCLMAHPNLSPLKWGKLIVVVLSNSLRIFMSVCQTDALFIGQLVSKALLSAQFYNLFCIYLISLVIVVLYWSTGDCETTTNDVLALVKLLDYKSPVAAVILTQICIPPTKFTAWQHHTKSDYCYCRTQLRS